MNGTSTFTIRVPTEVRLRLDKLAKALKRTRSWLAADAVEHYITEQERYVALLEQADREVTAGRFVSHDKVARWLQSWGTKNELPPPVCK